jgi:hypothetical protein
MKKTIHALSGIRTHDPSIQEAKIHALERAAAKIGKNKIQEQKIFYKERPTVCANEHFMWIPRSWLTSQRTASSTRTVCLLEQSPGFLAAIDVALKERLGVRLLWIELSRCLAQRTVQLELQHRSHKMPATHRLSEITVLNPSSKT